MAIAATVLVVGVKLLRRPRVERGQRRWKGGVRRRRILGQWSTILEGVLALVVVTCISTLMVPQDAAAIINVSAH